jgi:hypothetical protein
MPRNRLSNALRTVLLTLAVALAPSHSKATQIYNGKYEVIDVKVLADGKWQSAEKTAPGQFLFEYAPSWPQPMTLYVTWDVPPFSTNPNYIGGPKPCHRMSDVPHVVITRNGEKVPGHAKAAEKSFTYAFANVSRSPASDVRAECIMYSKDRRERHTLTGEATISFRPRDPLHDWDPGLAKPSLKYEIQEPNEGESLPTPIQVVVKTKLPQTQPPTPPSFFLPKKLGFEVEKAIDVQTGVSGDIALPDNKPYITWKAVNTVWLDVEWTPAISGFFQTGPQLPGNLFSGPGLYQVRVRLGSTYSPWRSFNVKVPKYRKVS